MRNSKYKYFALVGLGVVGLAVVLQGCANKALDKKIDNEISQESTINSGEELQAETKKIVQNSPGLSREQRSRLEELQNTTALLHDSLRTESYKLRLLLVKNLLSEKYDQRKVNSVEQRIKTLENKRLAVTFNAIQQAKEILGHEIRPEHRSLIENYFDRHDGLE